MRTLAIIFAIIALLVLVVVLIAPNVELDDYSDQPFYHPFALLAWFLLQLLSVCDCLRIHNTDVGRLRAQILPDLRPASTPVTATPVPLLC